jgi:NAD(P)H-hydrate epimerase
VRAINTSGAKIFAVDLPSGLNADTGEPMGDTIRAQLTGTMVSLKPGLLTPTGLAHAGKVAVVGLGLPQMRDNRWLVC